jgi:hypothetical protein
MCVTLGAAKLSNTIVYAAERTHLGRQVHVLGYQNKAENYERGVNAMILPIPAKSLTAENAVDMSGCKEVLKSYRNALMPTGMKGGPSTGRSLLLGLRSVEVSVFKTGSYTVVVANEPRVLPEVVASVAPGVHINPILMDAYAKAYDGWRVAVCLFEQRLESEPLMFQFDPLYPEHLFVPTLDAHDGHAPKPSAILDHTIVFGAELQGEIVRWMGGKPPADDVAPFFADRVIGFTVNDGVANGDHWLRTSYAKTLTNRFTRGATLHLPAGTLP